MILERSSEPELLRLGPRPTIGLLTAGLRDPYATVTWQGVMDAASSRDVNVLNLVGSRLHSPIELEAPAQVLFELVDHTRLDGLVVFSEMLYHFVSVQELKAFLTRYSPLPMTSIGSIEGVPSATLDIEEGMCRMVAHMVEVHGFHRLAYLAGPAGEETAEAQYRGYLRALAEHDIPFNADLVTPNSPDWGVELGVEGARVLLDERKLKPGRDLDCVVGCADLQVQALAELFRARGFRVPYDIAVTGYNNLEPARLGMPGLTTVDRKIALVARRATEMLLDLLDGKLVPDKVVLPPELVLRRSCGCMPRTVSQAAAKPRSEPETAAQPDFAARREAIVAQISDAGRSGAVDLTLLLNPKWADRLVESFLADLDHESPGEFFATLEEILRQTLNNVRNPSAWQGIISVMRQEMRPLLPPGDALARAENLWQQARVVIGDFAERAQGRRRLSAAQQVETLSDIAQSLITTVDVAGLMDVLARDLPRLEIPSGFLSLYEDSAQPCGMARLLLAYTELGRVPLERGGLRFPAGELAPRGLLPEHRRYDLVALPLYFQDEQLGLVVLELGLPDGHIYEGLRMQISSALKGALLATRNVELYHEAVIARQAAEGADRLKSRFLSTVSHELRTPLSLIVGTIEMLLRERSTDTGGLPAADQRDLFSIRTSAQHLARLISDVLDLASSQAGELRLTCEPLHLGDVMAQVTMLGESIAREKGLSWSSDIPRDLPVVWGDRTRLQQVVLNLISNAVKFTEQGSVRLWAEVGKQQVLVAITDSGMGISPVEQEFIFDEFRQSERAARRGYGGMGLGLAISRRLVELHGGKIGVLSTGTDGAGSTFYFTLPVMEVEETATLSGVPSEGEARVAPAELDFLTGPVAAAEVARTLGRQGYEAGQSDGDLTLLVVDDETGFLELHARLLEEAIPRCQILKANDGRAALEIMVDQRPDLVLLDLMMPELDGFGVLEAMRERESTRDVPVIVLTAQHLTRQDMARLQRSVAAVLSKGLFSNTEVLAKVTDALGRSRRLGSEAQRVVRQAMAHIHEHYAEPFSREETAEAVGLSDRYLTRCFHEETGITPVAYLNRYRIRRARALLERNEMNITQIALATGFADPSYFARVFREEVGVTPRAYQRGERAPGDDRPT